MLTVKKGCEELDNWNSRAKNLVRDLENTIEDFSKLITLDKENFEPIKKKIPVKAFQILTESQNQDKKADPSTLKKIIRLGIYKLRKSSFPILYDELNQFNSCSVRCSSIDSIIKQTEKKARKHNKKKKSSQKGKTHEKCKIFL